MFSVGTFVPRSENTGERKVPEPYYYRDSSTDTDLCHFFSSEDSIYLTEHQSTVVVVGYRPGV